ncbi:MAG: hypothetical protein GY937_04325 [bacterium]|nr:hypothetical protein [bacterium]
MFAWFNAWEYEQTGNLAAGLAQETVKALVDDLGPAERLWLQVRFAWREHGWRFARTSLAAFTALAGVVLGARMVATAMGTLPTESVDGVSVGLGGGLALGAAVMAARFLGNVRELWSHPLADQMVSYLKLPDYAKHLGLIPVLHRHLAELCKLRGIRRVDPESKGTRRRLVVFVDALRLVMVIPEVVLIVGIDARIAFRAVGSHYKGMADEQTSAQDIARDFLGKIIQLPIRLGRPDDLSAFVHGLFASGDGRERSYASERALASQATSAGAGTETPEGTEPDEQEGEMAPAPTKEGALDKEGSGGIQPSPDTQSAKAAVRADLDLALDLDMTHGGVDPRRFEALAKTFEIDNPRRLLRLRNCYRLLKVFDLQRAMRIEAHERREDSLLMAALFWQEFLCAAKPEVQASCEDVLEGKAKVGTVEDPAARRVVESFAKQVAKEPAWSASRLRDAREFVRRLVLPRGEGGGRAVPPTPHSK